MAVPMRLSRSSTASRSVAWFRPVDIVRDLYLTHPQYLHLEPIAIACLAIALTIGDLPPSKEERLKVIQAKGKELTLRHSLCRKVPKKDIYRSLLPNFGLAKRSATYTDTEIVDSVDAGLSLLREPWSISQLAAFARDLHRIVRKRRRTKSKEKTNERQNSI